MTQLIGTMIALTLTLAVVPVLATAGAISPQLNICVVCTEVTPSPSTTPPSASTYAPGHGATPPGQGGTPPGQAKPAEPDLDEDDPDPAGTGFSATHPPVLRPTSGS
jgi:hypothetical protein